MGLESDNVGRRGAGVETVTEGGAEVYGRVEEIRGRRNKTSPGEERGE